MMKLSEDKIKEIKNNYSKINEMSPSEKAHFLLELKNLVKAENGPQVYENDIKDQHRLANVLGLKFPESK